MNTNSEVERVVQDWLEDRVVVPRLDGLHDALSQIPTTPQTRARLLGRWFDRGEGARRRAHVRDHPPNTNRRTRIMFSATGITAALAILALSVSVIDTDVVPPSAHSATHIVAADGSGDFDTIQAAIDAASDGDTVVVRRGTYPGAVVIDKDITLTGQGARSDIVISHSDGITPVITFLDSDATLSSLTVSGRDSQVRVSGGAPTIEDVMFDAVGSPNRGDTHLFAMSLTLEDGTRATVSDNTFVAGGDVRVLGAEPMIEDNLLVDGPRLFLQSFGPDTVVRGNDIRGSMFNGIGLATGSSVLIEYNRIEGAADGGIIGWATTPGFAPTIRRNTIIDSLYGIQLPAGTAGVLTENVLRDNQIGIAVRSDLTVMANEIEGRGLGIMAVGGAPVIADNTIDVAGNGIVVREGTSPRIHDNRICTPGTAIQVADGATPEIGDNQPCE